MLAALSLTRSRNWAELSEEADRRERGFLAGRSHQWDCLGSRRLTGRNGPGHRSGGRGWHLTFHLKRREREREKDCSGERMAGTQKQGFISLVQRAPARVQSICRLHMLGPYHPPLPLSHQPALPTTGLAIPRLLSNRVSEGTPLVPRLGSVRREEEGERWLAGGSL